MMIDFRDSMTDIVKVLGYISFSIANILFVGVLGLGLYGIVFDFFEWYPTLVLIEIGMMIVSIFFIYVHTRLDRYDWLLSSSFFREKGAFAVQILTEKNKFYVPRLFPTR